MLTKYHCKNCGKTTSHSVNFKTNTGECCLCLTTSSLKKLSGIAEESLNQDELEDAEDFYDALNYGDED